MHVEEKYEGDNYLTVWRKRTGEMVSHSRIQNVVGGTHIEPVGSRFFHCWSVWCLFAVNLTSLLFIFGWGFYSHPHLSPEKPTEEFCGAKVSSNTIPAHKDIEWPEITCAVRKFSPCYGVCCSLQNTTQEQFDFLPKGKLGSFEMRNETRVFARMCQILKMAWKKETKLITNWHKFPRAHLGNAIISLILPQEGKSESSEKTLKYCSLQAAPLCNSQWDQPLWKDKRNVIHSWD